MSKDLKNQLDMLYMIVMSDGMGNSVFSDDKTHFLKEIQKALTEKYGTEDYKVRYLAQCVIKSETNEFGIQDKEWVRYILHQESEPDNQHESLLKDLEKRMAISK